MLQGFISGRSLSKGDGDSALGEMAPCNRRNTLHYLIGFCLSDALCLEVKICLPPLLFSRGGVQKDT